MRGEENKRKKDEVHHKDVEETKRYTSEYKRNFSSALSQTKKFQFQEAEFIASQKTPSDH